MYQYIPGRLQVEFSELSSCPEEIPKAANIFACNVLSRNWNLHRLVLRLTCSTHMIKATAKLIIPRSQKIFLSRIHQQSKPPKTIGIDINLQKLNHDPKRQREGKKARNRRSNKNQTKKEDRIPITKNEKETKKESEKGKGRRSIYLRRILIDQTAAECGSKGRGTKGGIRRHAYLSFSSSLLIYYLRKPRATNN